MTHEEDFDISFLDQDKLKEQEEKIENGETCNIENPETVSHAAAEVVRKEVALGLD